PVGDGEHLGLRVISANGVGGRVKARHQLETFRERQSERIARAEEADDRAPIAGEKVFERLQPPVQRPGTAPHSQSRSPLLESSITEGAAEATTPTSWRLSASKSETTKPLGVCAVGINTGAKKPPWGLAMSTLNVEEPG